MSNSTNLRVPRELNDRLRNVLEKAGSRLSLTKFAESLLTEALDQIESDERQDAVLPTIALFRRQLGNPDFQHPAVTGEIWKELQAMISKTVEEKLEEKKQPSTGSLQKPTAAGKRAGSHKRSA